MGHELKKFLIGLNSKPPFQPNVMYFLFWVSICGSSAIETGPLKFLKVVGLNLTVEKPPRKLVITLISSFKNFFAAKKRSINLQFLTN